MAKIKMLRTLVPTSSGRTIRVEPKRADPIYHSEEHKRWRERYADFGPTFAAEKLAERHDLKVSRETLRNLA